MTQTTEFNCYAGEHTFWCILNNPLEKRVRLPDAYIEWCIGTPPEAVVLHTGDNAKWSIKLRKDDESVYLADGWVAFRDYHMLRFFDALVFSHDDKVNLNVSILMVGGREHPVNRGTPYEFFETDREADSELLLVSRTVYSPTGSKRPLNDSDDNDDYTEAANSDWGSVVGTQPRPITPQGSPHADLPTTPAESSQQNPVEAPKVDRCRVTLPNTAVEYPYNVEIPMAFAMANLEVGHNQKLLSYSGLRAWSVDVILSGTGSRILWGWRSFAKFYKRKEGDVVDFIQSPTHPKVWNVNFPRLPEDA